MVRPVGVHAVPGLPPPLVYSGTKFAVEGITDCLRRELAPLRISVSLVEPAYVNTEIATKSSGAQASDNWASKEMLQVRAVMRGGG
jgi:NAD(P)-dependent dehydrogenase (short-subunit alcohol dehydrogenase family)